MATHPLSLACFAGGAAAITFLLSLRRHRVSGPACPHAGLHSRVLAIATCAELLQARTGGACTGHYGSTHLDEEHLYRALDAAGVCYSLVDWDDVTPPAVMERWAALLVRTTWNYSTSCATSERFKSWLARVARAVPVVMNDARVMTWNVSKTYLSDLNAYPGVVTIPTVYLKREGGDIAALARERGWSRVILKPCVSGGSRDTFQVDVRDEQGVRAAQLRLDALLAGGEDGFMLQPFISSVCHAGELSVIAIDGAVTHAVEKRPKEGEFRVQEEYGGVPTSVSVTQSERDAVAAVLRGAVAATGCDVPLIARVDFLRVTDDVRHELRLPDTPRRLLLLELECIEPCLFFGTGGEETVAALVRAVKKRMAAS